MYKRCGQFKNGPTSNNELKSGRPSTVTDELVIKIENAVRDNRKLTLDQLYARFPQICDIGNCKMGPTKANRTQDELNADFQRATCLKIFNMQRGNYLVNAKYVLKFY